MSSDTPLVWGDGVLLGAFVDDKFVAAAETSGLPPDLLGSDLQLLDRTMGTATWTLELDQCNAGALRSRDSGALFLRGWLWSADYPFTGTLEGGQVESGDADLVAALVELGIDPDTVERSTPPQSLDPDPELETVVRRLAPDIDTNGYEFAWLAVWDPTTSALITFAGDPVSNEVRFTLNGEGPTDVEGRGYLSDTITTDTNITLRELATGRTLSSVDVCNP